MQTTKRKVSSTQVDVNTSLHYRNNAFPVYIFTFFPFALKGNMDKNTLTPSNISRIWDNNFLESSFFCDKAFTLVQKADYEYCIYKTKLNIFSFGFLSFSLPFHIIAPPISIESQGFSGKISTIIKSLEKEKGLYLFLNVPTLHVENLKTENLDRERNAEILAKKNHTHKTATKTKKAPRITIGQTLASMVFKNTFTDFGQYMEALKSSHRRRLLQAEKKAEGLTWQKIEPKQFDEDLYQLYLNVWKKTPYPLEKLEQKYFQTLNADIYVLYKKNKPLCFIQIKKEYRHSESHLFFLFGGMCYGTPHDIYLNILIQILKIGMEQNVDFINFGQTSEYSKGFIGALPEKRHMVFFSRNKFISFLATKLIPFLEYTYPIKSFHTFTESPAIKKSTNQ